MRLFEGTQFDVPPRCDRCNELEADCQCPPPPPERKPADSQEAKVSTEKRKRGKIVTLVSGLSEPDTDLSLLTKTLKDYCGSGGTLKDEVIEIQGDQQGRVREKLAELGYRIKQ